MIADVGVARVVERAADRRHLAVHHAAGADQVRAGLGLRDRDPPVALERRVVVDLAAVGVEHAAVAVVGVLVQAEVAMTTASSPNSSRSARIARWPIPSGFQASEPSASLSRRDRRRA